MSDLIQFGVPLDDVMARYGEHIIPSLLKELVLLLYQCVEVVDIFRLVVDRSEISVLIHEINSKGSTQFATFLSNLNPHVIANLFLIYLDNIPGGLLNIPSYLDYDFDWLPQNLSSIPANKMKILMVVLTLLLHFDRARTPGTTLKELATVFGPVTIRFGKQTKHNIQSTQKSIFIFEKLCEEEFLNQTLKKNPPQKTLVIQKEILPITQQRLLVNTLITQEEIKLNSLKNSLSSLKSSMKSTSSCTTVEELIEMFRNSDSFFIPSKPRSITFIPTVLESKLQLVSGHCSEQGKRKTMEDEVVHFDDFNNIAPILLPSYGRALWAVYDGHSGSDSKSPSVCNTPIWVAERHHMDVAYYLAQVQSLKLSGSALHESILNALKLAVYKTDKYVYQLAQRLNDKSGSTSVLVYQQDHHLYVSNLGDSECVLGSYVGTNTITNSSTYSSKRLSFPHKPETERKRIEELGGNVTNGRVGGLLGVARAFGDITHKKESNRNEYHVSIEPFLAHYELNQKDRFLILACDGLWDVMSYQGAVDFVAPRLERGETPEEVAEVLVDTAINELKSSDNVSVIIVSFKWTEVKQENK